MVMPAAITTPISKRLAAPAPLAIKSGTMATTMAAASSELEQVAVVVSFPVVDGEPAVEVSVAGTVDTVFAGALPGGPEQFEVEATATAVARLG